MPLWIEIEIVPSDDLKSLRGVFTFITGGDPTRNTARLPLSPISKGLINQRCRIFGRNRDVVHAAVMPSSYGMLDVFFSSAHVKAHLFFQCGLFHRQNHFDLRFFKVDAFDPSFCRVCTYICPGVAKRFHDFLAYGGYTCACKSKEQKQRQKQRAKAKARCGLRPGRALPSSG